MKLYLFLSLILASSQAKKVPNGYIILGHDAVPHSAPSIVSLSYTEIYEHGCGGTIIAKDWILTAAHCANRNTNITIAAGLHAQSDLNGKVQMRKVDFIKINENYKRGPSPYDIALLHLSEPLKYNQYVQPAILPAFGEIHSGSVHLYGWGRIGHLTRKSSNVLQTVETKIVDLNDCKRIFGDRVTANNLCSDSLQKHISPCTGDSGGPLYIQREGVPSEVIGVVSWGLSPCGSSNTPAVYVRVSAYIDWILKVQYAFNKLH